MWRHHLQKPALAKMKNLSWMCPRKTQKGGNVVVIPMIAAILKLWRHGSLSEEAPTTPAEWRRQETEASRWCSTSARCWEMGEEEYMWKDNRVLRDNSGLVDTQLGCQRDALGSDPTSVWPVLCSNMEKWLIGIQVWVVFIRSEPPPPSRPRIQWLHETTPPKWESSSTNEPSENPVGPRQTMDFWKSSCGDDGPVAMGLGYYYGDFGSTPSTT